MSYVSNSEKIDFIERALGKSEMGSNNNVQVICPICLKDAKENGLQLRKRKLAISLNKNFYYQCWVCGFRGKKFSFVLKKYCSSAILKEYLQKFSKEENLTILNVDNKEDIEQINIPIDFKLLANVKEIGALENYALKYARHRGLTKRDLWYYKIGISSEFPWKYRLLFPSFDSEGNFNFMVGRSWLKESKYKYWNTKYSNEIIFNEINIDWDQELTITEGPLDLVKCNDNSVPLLGSSMNKYSRLFCEIIKHKTPVLLALDADMIEKKVPKISKLLLSNGIKMRLLNPSPYKDVGEMTKEEFLERKRNAIEWNKDSIIKYKISRISDRIYRI